MPVITLTTEWKHDDIYGGIIRGKLANMSPGTAVIDNAGNIPVFDIAKAAFIIRNTFENYPEGSVHIICVHSEPGNRECLIVRARNHYFIGSNNGIFNLILNSAPDEAVKISGQDELDLFARTASAIIAGKRPAELGAVATEINETIPLRAVIDKDTIIGSIIFIDSYGNAISNITREVFARVFANRQFRILIQSNRNCATHISQKYGDAPVGEMLARFNRLDLLELAINGANISELLSIETGSAVRIDAIYEMAESNRLF
ncbi:MAG: SAM-dependent chlorinase/fluorinase [Bacteroidales bacterium]|jgi:S-adenosylmethionine hydrolase|nr:SAM-dependent chlorinase/fluorinase [Bacteroidales bacterium]